MLACKSFIHLIFAMLILMPGGFLICYVVSLDAKHIRPLPSWPFVSNVGNKPPESCWFTLFLIWGTFVILAIQSLYYRYVIEQTGQSKTNIAALVVGYISCFGVTMVASFQWEDLLIPHFIGAFMTFIGSIVYGWLVVAISWSQMVPNVHGKPIVYLRIILAILETVSFILFLLFLILWQTQNFDILAVTISEWILIYGAYLFLTTFAFDLRNIRSFKFPLIFQRNLAPSSGQRSNSDVFNMEGIN